MTIWGYKVINDIFTKITLSPEVLNGLLVAQGNKLNFHGKSAIPPEWTITRMSYTVIDSFIRSQQTFFPNIYLSLVAKQSFLFVPKNTPCCFNGPPLTHPENPVVVSTAHSACGIANVKQQNPGLDQDAPNQNANVYKGH